MFNLLTKVGSVIEPRISVPNSSGQTTNSPGLPFSLPQPKNESNSIQILVILELRNQDYVSVLSRPLQSVQKMRRYRVMDVVNLNLTF